jgi:hypothetical protein
MIFFQEASGCHRTADGLGMLYTVRASSLEFIMLDALICDYLRPLKITWVRLCLFTISIAGMQDRENIEVSRFSC